MRRLISILLFSIATTSIGCDNAYHPNDYRKILAAEIIEVVRGQERPAVVIINGVSVSGEETLPEGQAVASGPVTVRVGIPFDVTVFSFTVPTDRPAASRTILSGRTLTLRVFDDRYMGVVSLVRTFTPRTDKITFGSPGVAEIIVEGVFMSPATGKFESRELRFPINVVP